MDTLSSSPSSSPIVKPNAQQIYESLRSLIIALDIAPGSRVTENQLADYFQVSRTPVRAALQRLESEGFLSIRAKQGCFIRNIDLLQVSQYYDVRVALENMVLEEVSKLKDMSALKDLARLWNPENLSFGIEVSEELKEAEEGFHRQLATISRNVVLLQYLNDINGHIRSVRRLGFPTTESITDTYDEHYRICQLLLHRDLATAQDEMTNHIRKSQDCASRVTLHQLYGSGRTIRFD
ncbi:MAG: GntR family transcriptional regulator [Pseudomonadota bacterium]